MDTEGFSVKEKTTFFLGANTPTGFHSLFGELYNPYDGWRCYILKGGPGTGKSTLMKRVCDKCDEKGLSYEVVRCTSDPNSLDAVRIEEKKVCIADGTAPHILNPVFPGAVDTVVDLSTCWNRKILMEKKEEIIKLSMENSAMHKKCVRYLQAAESLGRDTKRLALSCVDADKVERFASRLASRKFGTPKGKIGTESERFLSAVSPDGIFIHRNTIENGYKDILVVDDPYGAVSGILVGALRRYALGNGLDVISCPCHLWPDEGPEHILVPEIGFAVLTDNAFHRFEGTEAVRASRFTDSDLLRTHKSRIAFSRRTERELIDEAASAMQEALRIHDALEVPYKSAMDFDKVNEIAQWVSEEMTA